MGLVILILVVALALGLGLARVVAKKEDYSPRPATPPRPDIS